MEYRETSQKQPRRIPIREDLFTMPLDHLEAVRLRGSRCKDCGEVFLGKAPACGNCVGEKMEELILSNRGTLWSYTILRYQPPGDYRGLKDPYLPFAEGLVELPEGIRILAPLTERDFDKIKIGMPLELVVDKLYTDDDDNEVIAFSFKPAQT
jgi:uncharacterized OB-fold protein